MSANWKKEKQWADQFMPEIKAIVGMHIIGEAPWIEDATKNTDLIVLKMEAVRIAVRMRRRKFTANPEYRQQFTIRCYLGNDVETEFQKLLGGYGDFLFYGFEHLTEPRVGPWTLIDLNVFRKSITRRLLLKEDLPKQIPNYDGTFFRAFNFNDYPSQMIKAKGTGLSQVVKLHQLACSIQDEVPF